MKFKFDLNKFGQSQKEKSVNEIFKYSDNTQRNTKSEKKELPVYDFTILERNKFKKFINVDKHLINNESSNKLIYDEKLSFLNKEQKSEKEYKILENNNDLYILSKSNEIKGISKPSNKEYESLMYHQHNENSFFNNSNLNLRKEKVSESSKFNFFAEEKGIILIH